MPGLVASGHSHRPTTKVTHKAFKSRKATKGAIRDAAKGESRRKHSCQRYNVVVHKMGKVQA